MDADAIACCLMLFWAQLEARGSLRNTTNHWNWISPELVELTEDIRSGWGQLVNSSATDLIRFILNHESLTEEFCYMNRSGPYEWLGGTPGPSPCTNA